MDTHFDIFQVEENSTPQKIAFARSTYPRFLIADDHAMFAETLRVYLEKTYTV